MHGRLVFGDSGYRTFEAPRRTRSRMLFGIRDGKLAWIAIVDPRRVGDRTLRSTLANLLARAA